MDIMFAATEALWLLALIYQPVVLIYYVWNDRARRPELNIDPKRKTWFLRIIRPLISILSLSLSGFSIFVFFKILFMSVYGLEVLIYMLSGLILILCLTSAYLATFFASPNIKQLVYFAAFIVGTILTYAVLIPSGFSFAEVYSGEFSEYIIPFVIPGFVGFTVFLTFALALYLVKKAGKANNFVQKMSQPLWDKRRPIQKVFGFYFHLIIWLFLVLETILNQAGYTLLSWGV